MSTFMLPSGTPAPSSPAIGVTADGVVAYGEMDEEYWDIIPGVNPATGEPDSRYDGRVKSSVPIRRYDEAIHSAPDPTKPQLIEAVRSSDLIVARDLGIGLSQLAEDERLRRQADQLRRELFPGGN